MIIALGLHPTGHVAAEPMIRMLIAVHALALACVPVQFLGAYVAGIAVASARLREIARGEWTCRRTCVTL